MKIRYLAPLLLLFAAPAFAQSQVNVRVDDSQSGNVTTGAATCVAANNNIRTLFIYNNGDQIIWYRPLPGTAAAEGAGSTPIAANSGWFWEAGTAPRNGLSCISASGTQGLTVIVGYY